MRIKHASAPKDKPLTGRRTGHSIVLLVLLVAAGILAVVFVVLVLVIEPRPGGARSLDDDEDDGEHHKWGLGRSPKLAAPGRLTRVEEGV